MSTFLSLCFFISKSLLKYIPVLKHIPHWKIKSEMDLQIKLVKTQKHFCIKETKKQAVWMEEWSGCTDSYWEV